MRGEKGFTLIELLVVIAIIGILASVVLASLNTARARGKDAAIKATLGNFRTQAANYYDNNYNYGTAGSAVFASSSSACSTGSTVFDPAVPLNINAAIVSANTLSGGDNTNWLTTCSISANRDTWAISTPLVSTTTAYWCVDSINDNRIIDPAAFVSPMTVCP